MINKNIVHFQNNRMENNSFLIIKDNYCLIIDPSWNFHKIAEFLNQNQFSEIEIMLTHTHHDHTSSIVELCNNFEINSIYLSTLAKPIVACDERYLFFGFDVDNIIQKLVYVDDSYKSDKLPLLSVMLTPGHSACSMCIRYDKTFITGDTLFIYDIGRTDLLFSDDKLMKQSLAILKKYLLKNNNLIVCPGHGEFNTSQYVLKNNTFI